VKDPIRRGRGGKKERRERARSSPTRGEGREKAMAVSTSEGGKKGNKRHSPRSASKEREKKKRGRKKGVGNRSSL